MGIKSDIGLLVQKKMSHMDKDYIPAPSMLCAGIEMGNRACLGQVHGDDPERCCGEGGGRGVHVWERM